MVREGGGEADMGKGRGGMDEMFTRTCKADLLVHWVGKAQLGSDFHFRLHGPPHPPLTPTDLSPQEELPV